MTDNKQYPDYLAGNYGEDNPIAWRWMHGSKPDSDKCFPMPGPSPEVVQSASRLEFPRTVQYLYAKRAADEQRKVIKERNNE